MGSGVERMLCLHEPFPGNNQVGATPPAPETPTYVPETSPWLASNRSIAASIARVRDNGARYIKNVWEPSHLRIDR